MRLLLALAYRLGVRLRNAPALLMAAACGALPGYFSGETTFAVAGVILTVGILVLLVAREARNRSVRFAAAVQQLREHRSAIEAMTVSTSASTSASASAPVTATVTATVTVSVTVPTDELRDKLAHIEDRLHVRYVPLPDSAGARLVFDSWDEYLDEYDGLGLFAIVPLRMTFPDRMTVRYTSECVVLAVCAGEEPAVLTAPSPSRFAADVLHLAEHG